MKKPTDTQFKCRSCGKFIGHNDFINGNVNIKFMPDTNFTVEATEYYHKKCLDGLISIEDLGFVRVTPEELEQSRCKAKDYLFKLY